MLRDLTMPAVALVTGASRGIGLAMVQALLARDDVARVIAVSRTATASGALAAIDDVRLVRIAADLADAGAFPMLARQVAESAKALHLVFNAAGMLHDGCVAPEKSLAAIDAGALQRVFALNAFAPILLAQAIAPLLPRDSPSVFASLSARVGSIGDNRLGGWYAYRASKAAHNQLLRTLAVEWTRTLPHASVLALHPGTVDTALSRPYQANVPPARLFTPAHAARQLLDVIVTATPADSGRFLAWDGSNIAW